MAQMGRPGLSAEQKAELWTRWKNGQSFSEIGRALGKHAASIFGVALGFLFLRSLSFHERFVIRLMPKLGVLTGLAHSGRRSPPDSRHRSA